MLGRHYIIEHCITYCREKYQGDAYRFYITDSLRAIANNTSHLREGGMEIKLRFCELVEETEADDEKPQVTGEQVVNHYKEKLRRYEKKGGKSCGLDDSNSAAGN